MTRGGAKSKRSHSLDDFERGEKSLKEKSSKNLGSTVHNPMQTSRSRSKARKKPNSKRSLSLDDFDRSDSSLQKKRKNLLPPTGKAKGTNQVKKSKRNLDVSDDDETNASKKSGKTTKSDDFKKSSRSLSKARTPKKNQDVKKSKRQLDVDDESDGSEQAIKGSSNSKKGGSIKKSKRRLDVDNDSDDSEHFTKRSARARSKSRARNAKDKANMKKSQKKLIDSDSDDDDDDDDSDSSSQHGRGRSKRKGKDASLDKKSKKKKGKPLKSSSSKKRDEWRSYKDITKAAQEVREIQIQLEQIQNETLDEIDDLRVGMIRELEDWKWLIDHDPNNKDEDDFDDEMTLPEEEAAQFLIEELQEEQKELQLEMAKMEEELPALRKESAELEAAHEEVTNMEQSLNEFIKKKSDQNKKLEQSYNQMEEIYKGLVALEYESPMKEIFRQGIYRIAKRAYMSDPGVFQIIMEMIEKCEEGLGTTTMDFSKIDINPGGKAGVAGDSATKKAKSDAMNHVRRNRIQNNDNDCDDESGDNDNVDESKIDQLSVDVEEYAAALEQVSSKLDKKQFSMLLAIFKLLDKDKNGTIDPEEFRTGIKMLNRRLPAANRIDDADKLFKALDADGSGTIDLDEFQHMHISM